MTPSLEKNRPSSNSVLDSMSTALLCLNSSLELVYLNPACEVLLGVSARHCGAEPVHKAVPDLARYMPLLSQALENGAAYTQREIRLRGSNGYSSNVDCVVTPYTDRGGDSGLLLEFLALEQHLRISREAQMRNQNQANREMLRGLAHEIKNPLGGLRGAAQLLAGQIDDAELKDYTGVIIREADRLRRLVDDMLGPRKPPQKKSMNVHEALEHVRQLASVDLPEGIEILRDYDPSIPDLEADRSQLVQIFLNLFANAVNAIGESGRILMRTRAQRLFTIGSVQHRLVIRVDILDDGPGIPEDLRPKIFHPMVTSRADGHGMGLPIAQYLLHLHDGAIECRSRPGETLFSVYLPLSGDRGEMQ